MLTIKDIAADPKLAIQAQQLLINLKLLSGVADGKVGVQTTSAYSQLLQITKSAELTPELLQLKSLPQPELDFYRGNFAFRIAFGQYKAWSVGWHKTHEALVQVGEIAGYRDKNKDGLRTGDRLVKGNDFCVDQHWGYNLPEVDGASAGCLVGQSTEGHIEFMKLVKSDPRYQSNNNYVFLTTVLDGSKLI